MLRNAKKVKEKLNKNCSEILDDAIRKVFYEDDRLNKNDSNLVKKGRHVYKIPNFNKDEKILCKTFLLENKLNRFNNLILLGKKDEELISFVKEQVNKYNDNLEKLYKKTKIIKFNN